MFQVKSPRSRKRKPPKFSRKPRLFALSLVSSGLALTFLGERIVGSAGFVGQRPRRRRTGKAIAAMSRPRAVSVRSRRRGFEAAICPRVAAR